MNWNLLIAAGCALALRAADSPPLRPRHDPPEQPFRRAPMAESARSIVVNPAPDLHYAFDPDLNRVHTVWQGGPINLWGPPYSYSKDRFICDFEGAVLFSFPPVAPWQAAGKPLKTRFRSLSTAGNSIRLSYEVQIGAGHFRVEESLDGSPRKEGWTLQRHFSFPQGLPANVDLLAFAEAQAVAEVRGDSLVWTGTNGVTRATGSLGGKPAGWRVTTNPEDYEVTRITESGTETGLNHARFAGPETRAFCELKRSDRAFALDFTLEGSRVATVPPARSRAPLPRTLTAGGDRRPPTGDAFYVVEHFPLPPEAEMMITGMDWLPNGDLAVCTWLGEIYFVQGAAGAPEQARYQRYATGLNEPLGLAVDRGEIYVAQKGELTRVRDTDGDGVADEFVAVNSAWGYSGNYHSYSFGPLVLPDHQFMMFITGQRGLYDLPFQGWALRVDGDQAAPFCYGLRVPHGWGLHGPDQEIFVTDNQGNWIGACRLNCLRAGKFYGFPSSTPARRETPRAEQVEPPALWFPRSLAPSASGFDTAPNDGFGPFGGQLFIGDFQNSIVMRAFLEKVNGHWQGAVFPFTQGFLSGLNRLRFGPDGKLYAGGGKRTWSTAAPKEYSLERVKFLGKSPFAVQEARALSDGFELLFTEAVDKAAASEAANYLVKQFNYRYHADYGSPEYDHQGKPGATELPVKLAVVGENGKAVRLRIPGLRPGYVTSFNLSVASETGQELREDLFYYTLIERPAAP